MHQSPLHRLKGGMFTPRDSRLAACVGASPKTVRLTYKHALLVATGRPSRAVTARTDGRLCGLLSPWPGLL